MKKDTEASNTICRALSMGQKQLKSWAIQHLVDLKLAMHLLTFLLSFSDETDQQICQQRASPSPKLNQLLLVSIKSVQIELKINYLLFQPKYYSSLKLPGKEYYFQDEYVCAGQIQTPSALQMQHCR